MKTGTRIAVRGIAMDWSETWEPARIVRWTRRMGPRESLPAGFHPVRFDAGGAVLMVHESGFRVIDNRVRTIPSTPRDPAAARPPETIIP